MTTNPAKAKASRTRLAPGENSVERVADALPPKGPYQADVSVRLWDGKLKRFKIRAKTKSEFRRLGTVKCESALSSGVSSWSKGDQMDGYIDKVAQPAIEGARLRDNTKSRYLLAVSQVRDRLKGFAIGDAIKFRTLERALLDIADQHGSESARQARTVLSKYVLDQLIREELIDHNPLRGVSIDLGTVKKGMKPSGGKALTSSEYDAIVDHLIGRDVVRPLPPGTDRRGTSIAKHANVVALALLQAGTGLRVSEALALTLRDVVLTDQAVTVTVSKNISKTHRARTVPILDNRIEGWWRNRLDHLAVNPATPLISSPGNDAKHWRTDNAVKACASLYRDIGRVLDNADIAAMRSHAWRTVLNNRAIAQGVSPEIRAAYFGHDVEMNDKSYTDLTDIEAMTKALKHGAE